MSFIDRYYEIAKRRSLRVVLPEGHDERLVAAARRLRDEGLAEPILLGKIEQIEEAAGQAGVSLEGIEHFDPLQHADLEPYAELYGRRRDLDVKVARRMVKRPLFFGGMMVAEGAAHTMVAGAATATATVIQSAALTVGYAPGIQTVSSFMLMVIPDFQGEAEAPFLYADCAVAVQPSSEESAEIALASHESALRLLEDEPRVAMLSFSTKGSAAHADIDKVTKALAIARERNPEALIAGELQLDAATVQRVAAKKIKDGCPVAGRANVLVFPDLDAGNIGYKLTQYMAGATAVGPFLQGFAKPVSDLSRGASVDDIVMTTAITVAQVAED